MLSNDKARRQKSGDPSGALGRRLLAAAVLWAVCGAATALTVGQFSFYYATPFGSWCVATHGYSNRILPCS